MISVCAQPTKCRIGEQISYEDRIIKVTKSVTISIVDDDSWACDGIRELIESLGYQAHAFASAEQFLESGLLDTTACLITDVQMPPHVPLCPARWTVTRYWSILTNLND